MTPAARPHPELRLHQEPFGATPDGRPVERWTFGAAGGVTAAVLTYGGILQSCRVPDRDGRTADVVLALPTTAAYAADDTYLGALVGRYANRIAGAAFTLDGTTYRLPDNDRGNTLHGGPDGFHRRIWTADPVTADDRVGVRLRLRSPDGDMGFPGRLDVEVAYTVDRAGTLEVDYRAVGDRPTVVNLTQHAYWNLAGGGDVAGHRLTVDADAYLPVGPTGIPHGGAPAPVAGTPFALTGQPLADVFRAAATDPQLAAAGGLDHCYALPGGTTARSRRAAVLDDPASGRRLETWTTEPGLQVYTANGLGAPFGRHAAVCLETQRFPDTPNRPDYPSAVLLPRQIHRSTTHYRFTHIAPANTATGSPTPLSSSGAAAPDLRRTP